MNDSRAAFALLSLALGAASLCSADIDYNVDLTIGAGSATGYIATDGAIGVLSQSDIIDWNLLLTDGTATFVDLTPAGLTNPPGYPPSTIFSGSTLLFAGDDLTATSTQLLYDFSGASNAVDFVGGGGLLCFMSIANGSCGPAGISSEFGQETILVSGDSTNLFTNLSGTQVIGTVGGVTPEPSYLAVGAGILVLIGFRKLRINQQRRFSN